MHPGRNPRQSTAKWTPTTLLNDSDTDCGRIPTLMRNRTVRSSVWR
jgi:hypothetical protein